MTFSDALKAQATAAAIAAGAKTADPKADDLRAARAFHDDEHTVGAERAECEQLLRAFGIKAPQ